MTREERYNRKYKNSDYDLSLHKFKRDQAKKRYKKARLREKISNTMSVIVLLIWITTMCMLDSETLIPFGIFAASSVYLLFDGFARGYLK